MQNDADYSVYTLLLLLIYAYKIRTYPREPKSKLFAFSGLVSVTVVYINGIAASSKFSIILRRIIVYVTNILTEWSILYVPLYWS